MIESRFSALPSLKLACAASLMIGLLASNTLGAVTYEQVAQTRIHGQTRMIGGDGNDQQTIGALDFSDFNESLSSQRTCADGSRAVANASMALKATQSRFSISGSVDGFFEFMTCGGFAIADSGTAGNNSFITFSVDIATPVLLRADLSASGTNVPIGTGLADFRSRVRLREGTTAIFEEFNSGLFVEEFLLTPGQSYQIRAEAEAPSGTGSHSYSASYDLDIIFNPTSCEIALARGVEPDLACTQFGGKCFRADLIVDAATLEIAAAACGGDHFNWVNVITADSRVEQCIANGSGCDPLRRPNGLPGDQLDAPPHLDPPLGGYPPPLSQPGIFSDGLGWYYDEPQQLQSHVVAPNHLEFLDAPGTPSGHFIEFITALALVSSNNSDGVPLTDSSVPTIMKWRYVGATQDAEIIRAEAGQAGAGNGTFQLVGVHTFDDLSESERQILIAAISPDGVPALSVFGLVSLVACLVLGGGIATRLRT